MAISNLVKVLTVISVIFGLTVFSVSTWTLTSILASEKRMEFETIVGNTSFSEPNSDSLSQNQNNLNNGTRIPYDMFWAKLDKVSKHFRIKMIICTALADLAALFQVIASFSILCAPAKKVSNRSKYLVGVHFVTFIILLVCLFLPLGYDRDNDTLHSVISFNEKIMTSFEEFMEKGLKFIIVDIHAYYFAVLFDISIIFILMVLICCLMRCEQNFYDPV